MSDTSVAPDTSVIASDTGSSTDADTHDDLDAGECTVAEDCPVVAGPCRERACINHACRPKNVEGSCDDGDLCTTGDHCVAGSCVATPVVCQALDTCHARGACDPGSGTCSHPTRPDDSVCDDEDSCTLVDTCMGGNCVGSGEPDDSVGDWTVGLSGSDVDGVRWIEVAPDKSLVVAGTFRSPSLMVGDSASGTPIVLALPQGTESAVFIARFDKYGRVIGAAIVAASDGQIDCEGGIAVTADNAITIAGAWRGSFASDLTNPPDSPTAGIFVLRLSATFSNVWSIWGIPSGGGDVGAIPVSMDADAAGRVVIGVTGSTSLDLRSNASLGHIPLIGEDFASMWAGAAVISPIGVLEKVATFSLPEGANGSPNALAFTRVVALSSGRFMLAGALLGGLDAGPFSIAPSPDAIDFTPVVIFLDETFTPTSFARIPTGEAESLVTATAEIGGMGVIAVSNAGTGHMDTRSGAVGIPVWSGPALVAFDAESDFVWLGKVYSPSDYLVLASIAAPSPDSGALYVLALHRGMAVFGDASPPVAVAPADTTITTMSIAAFAIGDGTVIGALSLTDGSAGLSQISDHIHHTSDAAATPDGIFIGGRFAGELQDTQAIGATADGFVMRRNSHGGMLCK